MELKHGLKKVQKLTNSGIYLLEFYFEKEIVLDLKISSNCKILPGYYFYVGSAQTNLKSRLNRHLRTNKKKHWHIDYLTTHQKIVWKNIYILNNKRKEMECKLVSEISKNLNLELPIKGFGNSDCNKCTSHLLYSNKRNNYNQLLSLYHFTVLSIPSSREICWE